MSVRVSEERPIRTGSGLDKPGESVAEDVEQRRENLQIFLEKIAKNSWVYVIAAQQIVALFDTDIPKSVFTNDSIPELSDLEKAKNIVDLVCDAFAGLTRECSDMRQALNMLQGAIGLPVIEGSALDAVTAFLNRMSHTVIPDSTQPANYFDGDVFAELVTYFHDLNAQLVLVKGYLELMIEMEISNDVVNKFRRAVANFKVVAAEFFQSTSVQPASVVHNQIWKASNEFSMLLMIDGDYSEGRISKDADVLIPVGTAFVVRLLNNLLFNTTRAYQSMGRTNGVARIRTELVQRKDGLVFELEVEDEGPGFPNARQARVRSGNVFVEYIPEDGKTEWSGSVAGTGTGLAGIVRVMEPFIEKHEAGYQMGTYFVADSQGVRPGGARSTFWWKVQRPQS